jgi:hypothetical protein
MTAQTIAALTVAAALGGSLTTGTGTSGPVDQRTTRIAAAGTGDRIQSALYTAGGQDKRVCPYRGNADSRRDGTRHPSGTRRDASGIDPGSDFTRLANPLQRPTYRM